MRMHVARWIVSGGLVLGLGLAAGAQAPQPQQQQAPARPSADMSAKCQAMMQAREGMMAEMKEADRRLSALVATMNQASGPAKVDAVAAVVTEMVAQRETFRDRMMQMQQRMMSHMGEHMQAGAESLAMCPLMKMAGPQR